MPGGILPLDALNMPGMVFSPYYDYSHACQNPDLIQMFPCKTYTCTQVCLKVIHEEETVSQKFHRCLVSVPCFSEKLFVSVKNYLKQ